MIWGSKKPAILVAVLASILLLASTKGASAATNHPQYITISPTSFNLTLNAGSENTGSFTVINQGTTPFKYLIYAEPYSVKGEDYSPIFTPIPGAPKVAQWFSFSASSGYLTPGSDDLIDYKIDVPANTPAGGYYAVAFAQTNNPKAAHGLTTNSRVGSIFYINIPGNVKNSGYVKSWDTKIIQGPPLTTHLTVVDNGAYNFQVKYVYRVSDVFGATKYLQNGAKNLLPYTSRKISIVWPKTPSIGIFKVSGYASVLNKSYPIHTKYVLIMSRTVKVYVIASIVVLLAIFVPFYAGSKTQKLRQKRKAKKSSTGTKKDE